MSITNRVYLKNAYCFQTDTTVFAVRENFIALNSTCFYPGGGGQPQDKGSIIFNNGQKIEIHAAYEDDNAIIWHEVDDIVSNIREGIPCTVRIDRDYRLGLMRYHTALHVFNTIMLSDYDGWITGVSINPGGSHIDFKLDKYESDMRPLIEARVNGILEKKLPIKAYYISEKEFKLRSDLLRTLDAQPPIRNGQVRVVEIEGFEAQACGGTHVRNTVEVGSLTINKVKSKGRNNRRFYVKLII